MNGKRYVGGTLNMYRRLREHKNELRKCKHGNSHLQNACNKHGENNLVFLPLLYCDPKNVLLYEQICIDGLRPEYNIALDASAPMKGHKHTEESRRKMSAFQSGRKRGAPSEETREKIRASNIGQVRSEETRKKNSAARLGKPQCGGVRFHSDATKLKMSQSHIGKPTRSGFHHSEETRRKISAGGKGRVVSDETRARMSAAGKGKQNMLGHKHSEETKQKMRVAQLIRRAKEKQNDQN